MKKVGGPLRIEYAQYRELASFAQFGSDLDKSTKASLEKGKRIVEMLKQEQYSPMKVEEQVLVIYAVTNNFLKEIEVDEMKEFEKGLIEHAHSNSPSTLDKIKTSLSKKSPN